LSDSALLAAVVQQCVIVVLLVLVVVAPLLFGGLPALCRRVRRGACVLLVVVAGLSGVVAVAGVAVWFGDWALVAPAAVAAAGFGVVLLQYSLPFGS
jgi:hypothetical protein